jgi:hypothetical protein
MVRFLADASLHHAIVTGFAQYKGEHVLVVGSQTVVGAPLLAAVRERAEQPLRFGELGAGAPILRLPCRPRELPRPALEDLVGRVRLALADRAQEAVRVANGIRSGSWMPLNARSTSPGMSSSVMTVIFRSPSIKETPYGVPLFSPGRA